MTRTRSLTTLTGAATVGLVALAVAGCGGGGSGNATAATGPPKTASAPGTTVGLASTGLGKVLVNSQGRTLYLFAADHGSMSVCSGACATAWPPLRASGKPTVGPGLQASAVSTTKRSDGAPQVTYHGHPLYTYIGDQKPGDTTGQGINGFGGPWFALTATGAQASGSASSSNSGGGNGY
jgi:predicted lipoprotein with Yx(FWY)xxD motif